VSEFRLSLGASHLGDGKTRFRVWAPDRRLVDVVIEQGPERTAVPMSRDAQGYFEVVHPASPGQRYRFRLDGGEAFPDPCSRFQPEGPHGPSEIVDPAAFPWSDGDFPGLTIKGQVIYELHVGAYTPEGTFAALERELPALKDLGVTCLEVMPINTFPGRFNWGYDGVGLFAPCAVYGRPEEVKHFVDAAHRLGLGVILDVVYNHLGPSGNYLGQFARAYFSDRYPKEWGDPPNFDGERREPVRDFFLQNACYWVSEYHFDGLRVDATQSLYDASARTITDELEERVRAITRRPMILIGENEPQDETLVKRRDEGGFGYDAIWVDDFHHAARVALTGSREAYLADYQGTPQELVSCALRNALFQGQWYEWQKKPRGGAMREVGAERAVFFLQNHDQVANQLQGSRLQSCAGLPRARALTAFWLLLPQTPLLFMGQEFFASTPFLFFTDHEPDLQRTVARGREGFLSQFPSAKEAIESGFYPPSGEEAFRTSKLNLGERRLHAGTLLLHKELLRLRREDPVFARQDGRTIEAAVLGPSALALRYRGGEAGDRLVLLNLGAQLDLAPCPEPLLAPPRPGRWGLLLASEESRFGGSGVDVPDGRGRWKLPGQCTLVLTPEEP
jgi:maltooligosyltrehalose trehalohydrolase